MARKVIFWARSGAGLFILIFFFFGMWAWQRELEVLFTGGFSHCDEQIAPSRNHDKKHTPITTTPYKKKKQKKKTYCFTRSGIIINIDTNNVGVTSLGRGRLLRIIFGSHRAKG